MEEKVSKIVKLLVDYTPAKDKDYYYNFETTIVEQSKHYEPLPTYKYGVFCIRTYRTTDGNILKSANKDYLFPVKKFEVGYLDEFDPTTSVDSMSGPAHSEGNICIVKAFSITPEIFNLYSKIQGQVKPENTIFDPPIPTQIESNLHVTSEKKVKVIGFFAAAGVAQRILFIDWKYPQDPLTQRTLMNYTKYYKDECLISEIPSYWVY